MRPARPSGCERARIRDLFVHTAKQVAAE